MILGQGAYGSVCAKDGKAAKKFSKLSHLIQEYTALQYLNDCKYVVHDRGVDFANLELYMDLYDCSLRDWLSSKRPDKADVMKMIHDILMGLIELHDRALAHGDLKPGNILVRKHPLSAVLGDCGFVSIAKYAKSERTAPVYRDPVVGHDSSHDMFSFGICLLEMIADIRINRQATYGELKAVVRDKVPEGEYKKIIYNLLHEDKSRRPTARTLLHRLFGENPPRWRKPVINISDSSNGRIVVSVLGEHRKYIRTLMKTTSYEYKINRSKKGYGALIAYIDQHQVSPSLYRAYAGVTLMILSSLFGKSGFREKDVYELCERKYSHDMLYTILRNMLRDSTFINIILTPP